MYKIAEANGIRPFKEKLTQTICQNPFPNKN